MLSPHTLLTTSLVEYIENHKSNFPLCISIIGSGGKTSLIELLAEAIGKRVLIITTTHMAHPTVHQYPFPSIIIEEGHYIDVDMREYPIVLVGSPKGGKVGPPPIEILEGLIPLYDVILCEADGAHHKNLKYHREYEPVIFHDTSLLIKVLGLSALHKEIDKELHNDKLFYKETRWKNNIVENSLIYYLSSLDKGLGIDHYKGDEILLYNQSDALDEFAISSFIEEGKHYFENYPYPIFIGSVKLNTIIYEKEGSIL